MKNKTFTSKIVNLCSENYKDLFDMISNNGGFLTAEMSHLKEISGHNRLNKKSIHTIKKSLSKNGISYYPDELPLNPNKKVRLYIKSSTAGSILYAILSMNDEGDNLIHELPSLVLVKNLKDTLRIEDKFDIPPNLLENPEILSIFSSLGRHSGKKQINSTT
jgi:hypothetical protein